MYVNKDPTSCKAWLKESNPELFDKIYPPEEEKKA